MFEAEQAKELLILQTSWQRGISYNTAKSLVDNFLVFPLNNQNKTKEVSNP